MSDVDRIIRGLQIALLTKDDGLWTIQQAAGWLNMTVGSAEDLLKPYRIRKGNSNYYKPEDVLAARDSLNYGRQA